MSSVLCILIISTFLVTRQSEKLVSEEKLVADESLCRITKAMSGKEFIVGTSVIKKKMSCECSLPDKNAVMMPTFVGQSKQVLRRKKN